MNRKILGLILLFSVVIRIAAAVYLGDEVVELPGTADQISYHTLALRVLDGHGFTFGEAWWPATPAGEQTAHWSFLYTFYLMGVYTLFGPHPIAARILQAILVGLLQPWLTYKIGEKIFSPKVGLWAAGLNAVYIYFIYYSGTLMTEPFYITSILGALWFAIQLPEAGQTRRTRLGLAAGLGLTLGVTVLFRQLFLLFIPFMFLWLLWAGWKNRAGLNGLHFALPLAIVIGMILPFSLFNTARFGHFVMLNTNSGYAFYWGNHPYYGTDFISILSTEEYRKLLPEDQLYLDEAALDQELLRRGLEFVIQDPGRYALLSLSRIPDYFEFWPTRDSGMISNLSRVLSFGILWPFMLAGVMMGMRKPYGSIQQILASPKSMLLFFCLIYTAIHVLTWTLVRYRLPVDAVLLVFAGSAAAQLFNFLVRRVGKPG